MPTPPPGLAELAWALLRVGATAFGGHMALLGAVQKEAVERRGWLPATRWNDIVALAAILPGPMAVNAVACLGYSARGFPGAAVAMLAILAPSILLMTGFALLHAGHAQSPLLAALFSLMPAVVAAIVLAAAFGLGKTTIADRFGALVALVAGAAFLLSGGRGIAWIFLGAGLAGMLRPDPAGPTDHVAAGRATTPLLAAAAVAMAALLAHHLPGLDTLGQLFTGFAHTSLLMFGGGYTAVPLFQQLAVEQHGWIDLTGLADAIALSQLTPGPILTSAGFIGQRAAGLAGNAAALAGMFLPMALIAVLSSRGLEALTRSGPARGFLRGARPAAVALIATTGLLLLPELPRPAASLPAFTVAIFLLLRAKLATYLLIPLAGLAGLALHAAGL